MKFFRMVGRSIRDAFKSVIRNFSLSLASISCITITLIIIGSTLIIAKNVYNFDTLISLLSFLFCGDSIISRKTIKVQKKNYEIRNENHRSFLMCRN